MINNNDEDMIMAAKDWQANESAGNLSRNFSEFLATRRSTRDFATTPIPDELIEQLIADSLTAPSWSNTRPFKICVATGDTKVRISSEFIRRWERLSQFRNGNIFVKVKMLFKGAGLPTSNRLLARGYVPELKPRAERVGKELYEWLGVQRGDRKARDEQWAKNYEFFDAPVELFIYIHKSLHIFAANDAGLMLENLILSAHARGLGTCLQGAVVIWDDVIRDEFDVPKDYKILTGLAIGYPKDSQVNKFQAHRLSPKDVVIQPQKKV
jgi:nitroreductase